MMNIKIIHNSNELTTVAPFEVDKLLWGTKSIPKTYGYIAFVPEDAFYLRMICEEKEPLRQYTHNNDPVYQDSAMEAFFKFEPVSGFSPIYLNFEVNANGALLAGYGAQRTYRSYFTESEYAQFQLSSEISEDSWSAQMRIPVSVLEHIYGSLDLKAGSRFSCNFYKISETAEIEHYASYSKIKTATPSFHITEYFAEATLVE